MSFKPQSADKKDKIEPEQNLEKRYLSNPNAPFYDDEINEEKSEYD